VRISYYFAEDGYTELGEKIPDIPIVHLIIKVGRKRARGPAIVDTGFDGGIYPNMEIVKMFEGLKPLTKVFLENPIYGLSEFELYTAEAFLYQGGSLTSLGDVKVYIPTEPRASHGRSIYRKGDFKQKGPLPNSRYGEQTNAHRDTIGSTKRVQFPICSVLQALNCEARRALLEHCRVFRAGLLLAPWGCALRGFLELLHAPSQVGLLP